MKPVRLAVVGCGAIAGACHLPAALRSPFIDLVALVDRQIENAQTLARRHGLACRVEADLLSVISQVEAVLIATPNQTHFPIASAALSQGLPVLIEKPMTTSYQDAVRLCELAQQRQTFIAVGFVTRQYPSARLMKQLLATSYLGRIRSFWYELGPKGRWESVSGYGIDPALSGGGVLVSQATYFLDRMLYWFGRPSSFTYWDDNYGGVEANCRAELHYDNELGRFSGEMFVSKTVPLKNRFVLETDSYVCQLGERQADSVVLFPSSDSELRLELSLRAEFPMTPRPDNWHFQAQLEEFALAVRGGATPTVDGWAGAESVQLVEQMYQARQQLEEPWLIYRAKLRGDRVVAG